MSLRPNYCATVLGAALLFLAVSSANAQGNPQRNVYFGEQHVHTSWSFDAFAFGDRVTGPEEFYQYALGQPIMHPGGFEQKITKPLDWAADTEHSEYMGMIQEAADLNSPLRKSAPFLSKALELGADKDPMLAFKVLSATIAKGYRIKDLSTPEVAAPVWKRIVAIADKYYQPGKFTTFAAYEWTSTPDAKNLHRNIFFLDSKKVPEVPFTIASALCFSALIGALRRDPAEIRKFTDRCAGLCAEYGFSHWSAMTSVLSGYARVQDGGPREGLRQLEAAREALAATGAVLFQTYALAFTAEAHLQAGSVAGGLLAADEGLAIAAATTDRSFGSEFWRLKGELLLAAARAEPGNAGSTTEDAERCLMKSIDRARAAAAKSLELRAVTSLARLRFARGKSAEARRLRRPICGGFPETDGNADLAAARSLLADRERSSASRRARRS